MRTKTITDAIRSRVTNSLVTDIEYQPGNGSRYRVLIIDTPSNYVVALVTEGHGTCMTVMPNGSHLSSGYVREKLKVGLGDAVILAELIAHLTGRTADDASNEESYQ